MTDIRPLRVFKLRIVSAQEDIRAEYILGGAIGMAIAALLVSGDKLYAAFIAMSLGRSQNPFSDER